jgi:hypothetical protein
MYSPLENFRTIDSAILDDKYKNIHIWKDSKLEIVFLLGSFDPE